MLENRLTKLKYRLRPILKRLFSTVLTFLLILSMRTSLDITESTRVIPYCLCDDLLSLKKKCFFIYNKFYIDVLNKIKNLQQTRIFMLTDEHPILVCVTLNDSDTWWNPSMRIKTHVILLPSMSIF